MPIDPEAIERFLQAPVPEHAIAFKGANPLDLNDLIFHSTGLDFKPSKTNPLGPHQIEGLAFALSNERSFLFYGMRLGKSWMALHWARHLRRANLVRSKGLVIAHAPIALQVWKSETEKHTDLRIRTIAAGPQSSKEFVDACESRCDLIAVAWSGLQQLFSIKKLSRKGAPKLYPDHEALRRAAPYFDHCIIDEIHFCQNHTSLRFNIANELLENCHYRLGLTGTPMGRDPYSIWAQAYLIDEGVTFGRNYYFFEQAFGKAKYNHWARSKTEWHFDKKKAGIFQQKLQSISLSYELSEVRDINALTNAVELEMFPEQQQAYQEVVDKFIKIDPMNLVEIEAVFIRLRQIASGYLPFVGPDGQPRIKYFGTPKLDWLKAFFEECPVQAIIFHEFIHSGDLICKAAEEAKVTIARLQGSMALNAKNAAVAAFQEGAAQFLIANHTVGGTALELSNADYICFYESPVSPIVRAQAAARPMARGARPLIIDDLICAPVERKIARFIQEGRSILDAIVYDRSGVQA
jgi:SNF2 family DNA or RNA helicase